MLKGKRIHEIGLLKVVLICGIQRDLVNLSVNIILTNPVLRGTVKSTVIRCQYDVMKTLKSRLQRGDSRKRRRKMTTEQCTYRSVSWQ